MQGVLVHNILPVENRLREGGRATAKWPSLSRRVSISLPRIDINTSLRSQAYALSNAMREAECVVCSY